jgi:hypothetical protein
VAGMGPAPKPAGQRRHRGGSPMANTLKLPAGGRKGDAPPWPFARKTPTQADLWAQLWRTPMAVAWERYEWTRVVARYVRLLLRAEQSGAPASLLAEVRQLEDRLGLSPMALLRLRWEITSDEVAEAREQAVDRPRIRAVE